MCIENTKGVLLSVNPAFSKVLGWDTGTNWKGAHSHNGIADGKVGDSPHCEVNCF